MSSWPLCGAGGWNAVYTVAQDLADDNEYMAHRPRGSGFPQDGPLPCPSCGKPGW